MHVDEIAPRLWRWTAPHPEWKPSDAEGGEGWEREVGCVYLEAADAVVLIDPLIPTAPDERERFLTHLDADVERAGTPVAILLTVAAHERSAPELAERFGAEVWAHEREVERWGARADRVFLLGRRSPGRRHGARRRLRDRVLDPGARSARGRRHPPRRLSGRRARLPRFVARAVEPRGRARAAPSPARPADRTDPPRPRGARLGGRPRRARRRARRQLHGEAALHLARMRVADEGVLPRLERHLERLLALATDVRRLVDARPGEVEVVRRRVVGDDDRHRARLEPVRAGHADVEARPDRARDGAASGLDRGLAGRRLVVAVATAAGEGGACDREREHECECADHLVPPVVVSTSATRRSSNRFDRGVRPRARRRRARRRGRRPSPPAPRAGPHRRFARRPSR